MRPSWLNTLKLGIGHHFQTCGETLEKARPDMDFVNKCNMNERNFRFYFYSKHTFPKDGVLADKITTASYG